MKKKIFLILLTIVLALGIGSYAYLSDYYHASDDALQTLNNNQYNIIKKDDEIDIVPDTCKAGIIFYPGAKVQYEAYLPLMEKLADKGILCILLHMPFNMAVLNINAAKGKEEEYPEVKQWYMAGHSLGAAMAASYTAKHEDDYDGLILLAGYSTKEINIPVLSIYGENDQVLAKDKYQKYKENLNDLTEIIISGGNHACFGNYGKQKDDGKATISRNEQQDQTATAIIKWIDQKDSFS